MSLPAAAGDGLIAGAGLGDAHADADADADAEARVAALSAYQVLDGQVPTSLVDLCQLAAQLCGVNHAAVNLIDDASQHQVAAYGADPSVCGLGDSMCAVTLRGGVDLAVDDVRHDPRFSTNPWVDGRLGLLRFYAASVLRTPGGVAIGTLCVFDEDARALEPAAARALATLANQVVDVLELRRRSRLLREAVTELTRSHGELAAFAGQVSHDLKTPLTAALGYAELLEELPVVAGDDSASSFVARLRASGTRMLELVDDLLAYAGADGGVQRTRVELGELMPVVVADLGAVAEDAAITWGEATLHVDRTQLRLLLQNLLTNALKYRRPDVPPAVSVTAARGSGGVSLQVADNGTGIPVESRADALAPLRRLRHDVPGTGLGLATCARIAAAHGGSLLLGDTPGGGLTVTVPIPD